MNKILLAGVDEAGRGPLAGPVVAAAVILDPRQPIDGLADSKKLSAAQRERLSQQIQAQALSWSISSVEADEIDRINILQASMLAMQKAVESLQLEPTLVQVDGNRCPAIAYPVEAIVKGDSKVAEISAASILAKVARDQLMQALHSEYPEYEFDRHKGYPTAKHRALLVEHGPCPQHRRSFRPVAELLD